MIMTDVRQKMENSEAESADEDDDGNETSSESNDDVDDGTIVDSTGGGSGEPRMTKRKTMEQCMSGNVRRIIYRAEND